MQESELICLKPEPRSWVVAWLMSTVVNAENASAPASTAEATTEDTQNYYGCLLSFTDCSPPAATKLPAPLPMVTAEDEMLLFQLPKGTCP